jgi:CBS domain-containing protein
MDTAVRELESVAGQAADAANAVDLGRLLGRIRRLIAAAAGPDSDALAVGRAASRLYDAFLVRASELARAGPGDPPGCFALAVLGSQGRREQFLATDQDNALILADDCGDELAFAAFAARLATVLAEAGMPPCPKGIMAASPTWRKSVAQWCAAIDAAAARPDAEAVLTVSLLADLRPVAGDAALVAAVAGHLRCRVMETTLLTRGLAREALRFGPPALLFGHLASGLFGLGHGLIDLKAEAVYPLILGIKALALDAGIEAPDTLGRLDGLVAAELVGEELAQALRTALRSVAALRLSAQAEAWRQGRAMENRVVVSHLSAAALADLETALKAAGRLRDILTHHFSLHCLT